MRNHFTSVRQLLPVRLQSAFYTSVWHTSPAHRRRRRGYSVSTVVEHPTYVSIPMEIMVNRPAAEVWKRVGKYCDIGEWLQVPCTIISGKDGEFGAVRSIGSEVLVGKTELSYTYTQPVREGRPYNLYHGTLEARPVTATTRSWSTLWSLITRCWPDDAAREKDIAQRTASSRRRSRI